ncbi:MAG: LysR family substrate-binding domain-containing protein [Chloroflexota bacterium]|nr:LysR family substrate-binding domain-containing protein [Chloroflexota bacterium]
MSAAADALDRVDQVVQGRRGRLSIGFSTAAEGVPLVREIMRRYSEWAHDVEFETTERDFSDPSAGLADGTTQVAFIFGPPPIEGLSSVTLLEERRLVAMRPDEPLAARASLTVDELVDLRWLRTPSAQGPWESFWFSHPAGGPSGSVIRTAAEWVTAVEAGRGVAYTMPTVMLDFANRRIQVVPVDGLEPAALLMAWHTADRDPLVKAFVSRALDVPGARTDESG